jgi:uncharacterized RDD family membrane protein YckC
MTTKRRDFILARAAATAIDVGIAAAAYVAVALISALAGFINYKLANFVGWIAVAAAIGAFIYNSGYLQVKTGQSIGKRQTGIEILSDDDAKATASQVWMRAGIDLVCILTIGVLFLIDRIVALTRPDLRRLTDLVIRTKVVEVAR